MIRRIDSLSNPVWKRYVAQNVEEWLKWLRNVHLPSYVDVTQRFIDLHPSYHPPFESVINSEDSILKMLWNEEFINGLSEKGLKVWANGNVAEFIDELRNYQGIFEIKTVANLIESNLAWFERVYAFTRADIIYYLRNKGRNI